MKSFNKILTLRILLLAGFLLLLSLSIFAQVNVDILDALAVPTKENENKWQIYVEFTKDIALPQSINDIDNFKLNPIKDPKNYSLIDVQSGQKIEIIYIFIDKTRFYPSGTLNNSNPHSNITIFPDPSVRFDPNRLYHLYVFNVQFRGGLAKSPPQKGITFPQNATAQATSVTDQSDDRKDSLSFTAADGREDSNIYVSGEAIASKGSKPNFTADVKVEIPFRKIIGNRVHNFNPFFELKAGQGPDVDPDTMKLGLKWEFPAWRYGGDNLQFPIRRILLRNAPLIEANKDWKNVNFIVDTRLRFISRAYTGKNVTFYFRPFLGQEFGKNLNSPVSEAKGKTIYRPLLGTTMNLIFPIQKAGIYDISFEGEYTRRWLLRREIFFEKTDDNGLQPLQIGKGPRDYLLTKFNLDFTKSFGLSLSYENGRLPPSFKTVNQKVSLGLTYKIKLE